jgi:hypothetical protein
MSTLSEREEALRRALFSAAQSIEPAADGFERIQARLGTPRPVLVAWIEGAWSGLLRRSPVFIQDFGRLVARGAAFVWERFGPTTGGSHRRTGPLTWLRPAAAMTVAIFVVAAGAYVAFNSSDLINSTAGQYSHNSGNGPGSQTGPGSGLSKTASPFPSSGAPAGVATPSSSSTCSPKPQSTLKPPPSGSTSPTTTPTTGTSSPGTSPSTTPSPSISVSSGSDGDNGPVTSGSQGTGLNDSSSSAVTTAYQHTASSQCGGSKTKHKHKKSTSTAAKVTGVAPAGAVDIVSAARMAGKAAS